MKFSYYMQDLPACDVGHITSSFRAQQVNAIYRFVTIVY
jgi:hypothetical protein